MRTLGKAWNQAWRETGMNLALKPRTVMARLQAMAVRDVLDGVLDTVEHAHLALCAAVTEFNDRRPPGAALPRPELGSVRRAVAAARRDAGARRAGDRRQSGSRKRPAAGVGRKPGGRRPKPSASARAGRRKH
ncbi:MAG TPA: hypothetical protein VMA86_13080, partial [Acetobacteraceae bacterium]|nr:hypothetical protein [Acetobacteraceae bacterium]